MNNPIRTKVCQNSFSEDTQNDFQISRVVKTIFPSFQTQICLVEESDNDENSPRTSKI